MAVQTVYLTGAGTGNAVNPTNAAGSTSGTWAGGAVNTATSWTHEWDLSALTDPQFQGVSQTVAAQVRKGSNSGNPSLVMNLKRGGVTIATSGTLSINSSISTARQFSFTPTAGDSTAGLTLEFICTAVGGSGTVRNSVELDYASITATTQAGLTPVTKSLDLRYNVIAPINKSIGLLWNVLASAALTPVTKSLDLRYNVLTSVTKSVALRYNVLTSLTKSLGLQYSVQAGVTKSLGMQWNVLASGGAPAQFIAAINSGNSDVSTATHTINKPAGAVAGDLVIIAMWEWQPNTITSIPAGSTQIAQTSVAGALNGSTDRLTIVAKTVGVETSYTFVTGSATWSGLVAVAYRNWSIADLTNLVIDLDTQTSGTNAPASTGAVTDGMAAVWIAGTDTDDSGLTHTPPTNFTERTDAQYATIATRDGLTTGTLNVSGGTCNTNTSWIVALIGVPGTGGGSLTPVTKSLGLLYNIAGSATKSVTLRFNVQAGVQKSLNTLYNVRASVQKSLGLQYNVLTSASKSLGLLYNVRTGVQKSLTVQYNVLQNLTPVTKALALQWNVVGTVQKQNQLLWNVRAGVQNPLALRWNVLTSVQKSLTPQWNVRAVVTDSLDLRWNVLASLGNVNKSLTLLWGVGGTLSKPLGLLYNVRAGASKSVALQWNVRTSLTDSLELQWNVRAPVTQSRSIRWNVIGGAQKSLALRYNVRAGVTDSLELQWNVASSLTAPIPFKMGDANVVSMRIGSVPANRLYLGADQIWP